MRTWTGQDLHPMGDGAGGGQPAAGFHPAVVPTSKPPNAPETSEPKPKIQHINQSLAGGGSGRHTDNWKRKTNLTGTGATHIRSFFCRLNPESLASMDEQINRWLDEHPDYEVKFVNASVGEWQGKIREPALIVNIWV